jgi:hypothetical protein
MLEAGSRKRNQPAPPHIMFEALTQFDRDPARPWLELPDAALVGHMRKRLNQLINANLRFTFGQ